MTVSNFYESDWKTTSSFGAREKLQVQVNENTNEMTINVIAESAFCAFIEDMGFVGLIDFVKEWLDVKPEIILYDTKDLTTKDWKALTAQQIKQELNQVNQLAEKLDKISQTFNFFEVDLKKEQKPLVTNPNVPYNPETLSTIFSDSTTPAHSSATASTVSNVAQQTLDSDQSVAQKEQPAGATQAQKPTVQSKPVTRGRSQSFPGSNSTAKLRQKKDQFDALNLQIANPEITQRIKEQQQEIENYLPPENLSEEVPKTLEAEQTPSASFARPRRQGIRPPTQKNQNVDSSKIESQIISTTDNQTTKAEISSRTLIRKSHGWIRPGLFQVHENQVRSKALAKIEQKVALLQLEVLISPALKSLDLPTKNLKKLLIDQLTHKIKEAPAEQNTLMLTEEEKSFLKALSKIF